MRYIAKLREHSLSSSLSFLVHFFRMRVLGLRSTATLRAKLCCLGIPHGRGIRSWGKVIIVCGRGSTIRLGNALTFVSSSERCTSGTIFAPCKLRTFAPSAQIILEDGVGLNGTSITARSTTIRIGRNTLIAPNVTMMDSDFHTIWPPEARHGFHDTTHDKGIDIGENVWIGSQSIVLKGVRIGDGAVIGARSVVTGDIPPNTLAVGSPARVIKNLKP